MRDHICSDQEYCWEHLQDKVKRLKEELKQLRAVAYNYGDFMPTCQREGGLCWVCDEPLHGDSHSDDCLATLFYRVVEGGDEAGTVWLELLDAKEKAEEERDAARAALRRGDHEAEERLSDERSKPSRPDGGSSTDGS